MGWLDAVNMWLGRDWVTSKATQWPEPEEYAGPGGPHYILDKYDDPERFYRVTGAPSQRASLVFMAKKLRRSRGEGLRDWSPNRLDEIEPGMLTEHRYTARAKYKLKKRKGRRK